MPDSHTATATQFEQRRIFVPIWRETHASVGGHPIACTINYALAAQVALERATIVQHVDGERVAS